jgi:hypothetical protein
VVRVYEPFLAAYVSAVENLTIGHPAGAVDLGPLASGQQLAKVKLAVQTAIGEGAEVITGGSAPTSEFARNGYWYAPTVLRGVRPEMSVMREETFDPVTPVFPVQRAARTASGACSATRRSRPPTTTTADIALSRPTPVRSDKRIVNSNSFILNGPWRLPPAPARHSPRAARAPRRITSGGPTYQHDQITKIFCGEGSASHRSMPVSLS